MANVKELVRTIIRETCTHWICADEQELERVETELEQKLKDLISSELALAESSHGETAALPLQNVRLALSGFWAWYAELSIEELEWYNGKEVETYLATL